VNVDGQSVDLAGGGWWSLGELARVIGQAEQINRTLKRRLPHGERFTSSLPPILEDLSRLRNPAAHSASVPVDEAAALRARVLGIGNIGLLSELARVAAR
jgi:hypothetical protein